MRPILAELPTLISRTTRSTGISAYQPHFPHSPHSLRHQSYLKPLSHTTVNCIRFYAVSGSQIRHNDATSYLKHVKSGKKSTTSSVFRGTLYEYLTQRELATRFPVRHILRCGGAFDNGVDLRGTIYIREVQSRLTGLSMPNIGASARKESDSSENITQNGQNSNTSDLPVRDTSELSEPSEALEQSIASDLSLSSGDTPESGLLSPSIPVLVQCKCIASNVNARLIRELSGIGDFNSAGSSERDFALLVLAAPSGLTRQAIMQMDATSLPVMFCRISPPSLQEGKDPYDLGSYAGGSLESVYVNITGRKLLERYGIEELAESLV